MTRESAHATRPKLRPTLQVASAEPLNHEEIARLAYDFWQARGCPHGSADSDWLQAEQELRRRFNEKKARITRPEFAKKNPGAPKRSRNVNRGTAAG